MASLPANVLAAVFDFLPIEEAAITLGVESPVHSPSDTEWQALRAHANGVVELPTSLASHEGLSVI